MWGGRVPTLRNRWYIAPIALLAWFDKYCWFSARMFWFSFLTDFMMFPRNLYLIHITFVSLTVNVYCPGEYHTHNFINNSSGRLRYYSSRFILPMPAASLASLAINRLHCGSWSIAWAFGIRKGFANMVEKCCFCCSLRCGTIFYGVYTLVSPCLPI